MITILEIGLITNSCYFNISNNPVVTSIITDSRESFIPQNAVFFALKGKNYNGHDFIDEAYKKNIRNFVVSENINWKKYENTNFVLCVDTLLALQQVAEHHRDKFEFPILAITGSNGKTVVKEWIYQLLKHHLNIIKSPKSYNSQLGVPLSVLNMNQHHKLAIFEAGISKSQEMQRLAKIIKPDIGIFINIGDAHQENFSSLKQKVEEKLKLFKKSKTLLYCKDYKDIDETVKNDADFENKEIITWSFNQQDNTANYLITNLQKFNSYTRITITYNKLDDIINLPFTDQAAIENAIFCYIFIKRFYPKANINFNDLTPIAMRMEMKNGNNNCILINDYYNCDIASLKIAINHMNQQNNALKKTLIISDIQEISNDQEFIYSTVKQILEQAKIAKLIGIGLNITKYQHLFEIEKYFYHTTQDFLTNVNDIAFENEIILLKGARTFYFEKISKYLQEKSHQTVLEINMQALANNLNYFKTILNQHTKILVMVKAFSYGSGAFEIANMLQHQGIAYLGVAIADEGVLLVKKGIKTPIIVMNPQIEDFDKLIEYKLEPEIYNFNVLISLLETLKKYNIPNYYIHIKIDSGMNRLGFKVPEIEKLIEILKSNPTIIVKSIFSHLAASAEAEYDDFTLQQINTFENIASHVMTELGYTILRHILNSAGIERFNKYQYEMVRLGIGLYGISAINSSQLMNISTLKTKILQIKEVTQTETIGYSRAGKVNKLSKIAILPIGYADGFYRRLGNGNGEVMIGKQTYKTIGNICMDMCMIDITDANVTINDEVIIFGDKLSISKIAKKIGTIEYEVLTNVSQRVKRIYFSE